MTYTGQTVLYKNHKHNPCKNQLNIEKKKPGPFNGAINSFPTISIGLL